MQSLPDRYCESVKRPAFVLALITVMLFTDMVVYDLVIPFMPEFAGPWLSGESELGLLFGVYALSLLVSLPFTGRFSDRIGPRNALLLGCAGLIITLIAYAFANGRVMLFSARIVQGVAAGITWTAGLAQLASLYPADRRGKALGIAMAGMSLGTLVGPPLGGIAFDVIGAKWTFLAVAIWGLIVLIGLFVLLPRDSNQVTRDQLTIRRRGWIHFVAPAIFVILGATFLSCLEPTLPSELPKRIGSTPSTVGILFGIAAIGYGIISPLAGYGADRFGNRRTMVIGLFACAATLPLVAIPTSIVGVSIAFFVFGASCSILLTPTLPEFAAISEQNGTGSLGAAYSFFNFVYAIGMAIGPVIAGLLQPRFGLTVTLCVIGFGSLFGLLGFRFGRTTTPLA